MPKFTFEKLASCIGTALNADSEIIVKETRRGDLEEWDSFGQVAIAVSVENLFNIKLTKEELFSFNTVEDLVNILEKKSITIE